MSIPSRTLARRRVGIQNSCGAGSQNLSDDGRPAAVKQRGSVLKIDLPRALRFSTTAFTARLATCKNMSSFDLDSCGTFQENAATCSTCKRARQELVWYGKVYKTCDKCRVKQRLRARIRRQAHHEATQSFGEWKLNKRLAIVQLCKSCKAWRQSDAFENSYKTCRKCLSRRLSTRMHAENAACVFTNMKRPSVGRDTKSFKSLCGKFVLVSGSRRSSPTNPSPQIDDWTKITF